MREKKGNSEIPGEGAEMREIPGKSRRVGNSALPQEQEAKTKMLSVVGIQQKEYLVLCTVTWDSYWNYSTL